MVGYIDLIFSRKKDKQEVKRKKKWEAKIDERQDVGMRRRKTRHSL